MKLTAEEKLMYSVMKAVYKSKIPISFKGAMVLKACLVEAGITEEIRHTTDIDANWNSDSISTEQIAESLQKVFDKNGISLKISVFRQYAQGRSAGFELISTETDEPLFTIDMDVNRIVPNTKIYEIEDFSFCGATPSQIIADKLFVLSTDLIMRRIKDMVDLYYLAKVITINEAEVRGLLKGSGKESGDFHAFLFRKDELAHAYEKFRFDGGVSKPDFEEVYNVVKNYLVDFIN